MKIAICLFGLYSGTKHNRLVGDKYGDFKISENWYNGDLGIKNFYEQLNVGNEIDFFVHTWNKNYKNEIIKKCNPVRYIIGDNYIIKNNKLGLCSKSKLENRLSCFYSRFKVNELRKKYQEENKIEYDFIIVSRFDLLIYANNLDRLEKNKLYTDFYMPQKIKFPKCLKKEHTKDFWDKKWYPGSIWISSNSDYINKICNIFDFFEKDYENYIVYFQNTKFSPHKQYGLFIKKQLKETDILVLKPDIIMVFIIRYYKEHIKYYIKYMKKRKKKIKDKVKFEKFVKNYNI